MKKLRKSSVFKMNKIISVVIIFFVAIPIAIVGLAMIFDEAMEEKSKK